MRTQVTIPKVQQHCSITNIGIFGSADIDAQHPLYQEAFNVARYLAYHGKVVVNGGGPGVMAAATLGAQSAGGDTVAVTFYPQDMPNFEGRYSGNHVKKEIKTANYIERMFGLMDQADAFIVFQGGTGTLSEWATAWLLAHLYYGNHKPIILYGEFWHKVMQTMCDHFFISEEEKTIYKIVKDEQELIEALNHFEQDLMVRCGLEPHPQVTKTVPPVGPVTLAEVPVPRTLPTAEETHLSALAQFKLKIRHQYRTNSPHLHTAAWDSRQPNWLHTAA